MAEALGKLLHGEFLKRVGLIRDKLFEVNRFLNGRQICWLIFQEYKRPETETAMLDFNDLINVELKGENLADFISVGEDYYGANQSSSRHNSGDFV